MTIAVDSRRGYIAGFRLTIHSMERMVERGLDLLDVQDTLQAPLITQPGIQPDTAKHVGATAIVVVNVTTKEVLTVYPNQEWSNR